LRKTLWGIDLGGTKAEGVVLDAENDFAVVINIVDPDVILLGGGVGNIDSLYTEGVEQAKKHIFNNRFDTIFLKPKLGDSAGVFGAAMLVL